MTKLVIIIAVLGLTACGLVAIKLHLLRACRTRLRARAEDLIIQKRRLERAASSPSEFDARWRRVLCKLRHQELGHLSRLLVTAGDVRRAIDAELVGILPQEVQSWTFLERVAEASRGYDDLSKRCLVAQGWAITRVRRNPDHGDAVEIADGDHRLLVYLPRQSPDSWLVQRAHRARTRLGLDATLIIANGDVSPAVKALAHGFGVGLLHSSQLDRIRDHVRDARGGGRVPLAA